MVIIYITIANNDNADNTKHHKDLVFKGMGSFLPENIS